VKNRGPENDSPRVSSSIKLLHREWEFFSLVVKEEVIQDYRILKHSLIL